jgi:RimJ/RimL family protein N-acetyltransferase
MRLDRILHGQVVVVRPFDEQDRDVLVAGRDVESVRFLGEETLDPRPFGCICIGELVVGWIDYDCDRTWLGADEVNVGYNVFPLYRGNGYGTEALLLLEDFLVGLERPLRSTLLVDPKNAPSLRLAARAGFCEVGRVNGEVFMKRLHQLT